MTDKDTQDSKLNDSDLSAIENILPVDEHEEEVSVNGKTERHRGIYLLPNLFTTAALFSGFYAIVSGVNGNFDAAAIAIFVSMIFDGLDGRVARLTNTQSKFGEQYDSLADMVSFGAAPALVMFSWALSDLGKFGWACSFIYMACAALRLARFNAMIDTADKNFFTGLASPAAASVVAGLVWVGFEQGWSGELLPIGLSYLVGAVTAFVGLLMIANIRYNSFKGIDLRGRVPFVALLIVVLVFALVTVDPARVLLATAIIYAFSGPAQFVLGRLKKPVKV
jgi:CDP-diacylglycerol---serine O-phosphatidyltransferase